MMKYAAWTRSSGPVSIAIMEKVPTFVILVALCPLSCTKIMKMSG
jgi:hypothetical protein